MTFQITVRIFQTSRKAHYWCVEKSVYHLGGGGIWGMSKGAHLLTMNGSGSSGILRLESDTHPETHFCVAVGIHNSKPWGSIVTGLKPSQTAEQLHPQFYNGGPHSSANLNDVGTYAIIDNTTHCKMELHIKETGPSHFLADLVITA